MINDKGRNDTFTFLCSQYFGNFINDNDPLVKEPRTCKKSRKTETDTDRDSVRMSRYSLPLLVF